MEPMGVTLHHAIPIIHLLWKTPYATSEITTSTISRSYASQPVGNRGTHCYYFLLRRLFKSHLITVDVVSHPKEIS